MSLTVAADLLARARDDADASHGDRRGRGRHRRDRRISRATAVEKAIKAVLAANGETFSFTHDLEGLIERCETTELDVPAQLQRDAGLLTPYAVRHRYGGEPPALVDRKAALALATTALEWATAMVEP